MSGSADTRTVTVRIVGVRAERIPRLRTAIKSEIQRFGSRVEIEESEEKSDGKSRQANVYERKGRSDGAGGQGSN